MSKQRNADATSKYCPDCKERRPLDEFYKKPSRYDGLSSYCIEHQLERDRKFRKTTHFQNYMREYMQQKRNKPKTIRAELVRIQEGLDQPKPHKPNAFDRDARQAERMEQARQTLIAIGYISGD